MQNFYVRVDAGVAVEIFRTVVLVDSTEVPIAECYHPDFFNTLIPVEVAPALGDVFDGTDFHPPEPSSPMSAEELWKVRTASVQRFIDQKAQALGYDNIYTAVSYADEPVVPKFQREGQALRAWRSLVWSTINGEMNSVITDTDSIPSDDQLIARLPPFIPPET